MPCPIRQGTWEGSCQGGLIRRSRRWKESADRFEKLDKETALWRQSHLHRNIVTLYDVFVSSQEEQYPGVWVVQEFMSMSLADLIGLKASGLHITEPHMARILLDGVLALEHLHYQNIIHRDVEATICC